MGHNWLAENNRNEEIMNMLQTEVVEETVAENRYTKHKNVEVNDGVKIDLVGHTNEDSVTYYTQNKQQLTEESLKDSSKATPEGPKLSRTETSSPLPLTEEQMTPKGPPVGQMENWKYFFVSSFVLSCCLRDAKSEKSDNEIDKTKWTPKLRDPVKIGHVEEVKVFPFHFRKVKTISLKPPIFEIPEFLTDVECDHLVSYARRLGLEKSPLAKSEKTIDDETSERTFKIWDNNHDGFIEPVEIMHVRGKEDLYFTEEDLLDMFKELDMDKDDNGKIDFEEFSKVTVPVIKEYFDKVRRTKPRLRSRNSRQVWMFHNDPKLSRLTFLPEEFINNTEPLQVLHRREKYTVHKTLKTLRRPCVMRVRGPITVCSVQTDPTLLRYALEITEQKKCLEFLAQKFDGFQSLRNNSQQHATSCNRVCKRTQHVTSNNVVSVCTGLNLPSAPILLVVKYDVHGHYHCHHDSDEVNPSLPCCTFSTEENCRLCRFATVLIYLNEPKQGGETAFPLAGNETFSMEVEEKSSRHVAIVAKFLYENKPKTSLEIALFLTPSILFNFILFVKSWRNFLGGENWKCNLAKNCHQSNLIVKPEKGKAIMWYNHLLDEKT
ncbi:unnamed protein product, partial [Porites evermanni]